MTEPRHKYLSAALAVAAALLIGGGWGADTASAQLAAQGEAVPADDLPPPSEWRCDRIAPEYSAFVAAGNDPQAWRLAGHTFRTADAPAASYQWSDWLQWYQANCGAVAVPARDRSEPNVPLVIGGVVAGIGVIGLIGSSSASDSPG